MTSSGIHSLIRSQQQHRFTFFFLFFFFFFASVILVCFCVVQDCVVYLCGTKYDLVEENKKMRKVDVSGVKNYADGVC